MKTLSLLLATSLLTPLLACGTDDPDPPAAGVGLPKSAQDQIEALLAEKAARTPAQRKIASALLYEQRGTFAAAKGIASTTAHDAAGRVLVDIRGAVAADRIAALGGALVSAAHATTRAWLATSQLEALAADPGVLAIRPAQTAQLQRADPPSRTGVPLDDATRAHAMDIAQRAWAERHPAGATSAAPAPGTTGVALSAGVAAHGVDVGRAQYGVDGTGVTVGVMSDSNDYSEAAIASGDLPADTIAIPGQEARGQSGEGTAMMEIVHDVAPGAKLVFATAATGAQQFADNIRALRFQYHADVIVDDVFYPDENPYQDDIVAAAVDDVTADGAVYVSSAGNGGNYDDGTSGTWEGDFKSGGTLATLPSGYTVHSFGDKVISDRIEKQGQFIALQWSDASTLDEPQSANDYDLFVLDEDLRNVYAASTDLQDGAGAPFEYLPYKIPPGYRIVIAKHPTAEVRALRATVYAGELGIATTGATFGHTAAAGALGAAAVDTQEAIAGAFVAGPTTPVELYSSDGPRRVFYDRAGNPFTPGAPPTFAAGGGVARTKPDIAGADDVATTVPVPGLAQFRGTSAAAPHVGAIAALMKSAVPSATGPQIRAALVATALDIEAAGRDRDSGAGVAWAPAALEKIGATPAVTIDAAAVTVTPNWMGSTDILSGVTQTLRVQLVNHGLVRATAVSARLTSSTPGVTISAATSTYPAMAAGATATDPLAYAFSVDDTVPCGSQLAFSLAVTYTGGARPGPHATSIPFTLMLGHPDPTPREVFAYAGEPIAIPDGDAAGIDVPLALAGNSVISGLGFVIGGDACTTDEHATTVGIDHTWVGDLSLALTSPAGTTVRLLDAIGTADDNGHNLCQTILRDDAPTSIESVTPDQAPFTGSFQPEQPLAAFIGQPASGTWTLHAADSATPDGGNLRAFSVWATGYSCN